METHIAYDTIIEANNPIDTIVRHSGGGVIYTVARPEHRQGILEVLARAFVNEPSTAGQSIERPGYDDWYRFTEFYMDECTTNGLSIVALDGIDGRTVAGAFINRDFLRPPDPRIIEFVSEPSPFAPVVGALDVIDKAWFAVHPEIDRTEVGRVVDLWMVGVHPGYRGRRIASSLSTLSLQHVAKAGFDYAIVECTGAFSQSAMQAAGCTSVYELPYTDFRWHGEAVFRDVPGPHAKWVIYEKKLTASRSRAHEDRVVADTAKRRPS